MATAHGQHVGGTHAKQYDNLKTLLKNAKSTTGQDLFAHLQDVFKKLILHYPDQALDKLEEVSYLLKHQSGESYIRLQDFLLTEENRDYNAVAQDLQGYIQEMLQYYKKPQPENEDEEPPAQEEVAPTGFVSDLLSDQKIFEWAGISFGEIEAYRIMKALKKLAIESGAGNVRFFGKILGSQADYYVAEGSLEGGDEEAVDGQEKPADFEARGTGVNKFVYWVTTNILSGKWTKLPDLLTSDIKASRQIKVQFTGDLDRPIYTNPFFFGQEKHYLRAQIARIYHSTTLAPKGLYKTVEDNEKEIEDFVPEEGELQMPSTHDMALAQNWVHYTPSILQVARTTHIEPEVPEGAPEEVTAESLLKELEDRDPYEKRLKPITDDSQLLVAENQKQAAWVVRHMGDKNVYQHQSNPKKQVNYGVVVVRSLQWPGSYTFYSQGRYLQVYLGNGQKYEPQQSYYPVHPPKIMVDPLSGVWFEQPEPTPLFEEVVQPEANENEENQNENADGEEY